MRSRPRRLIDRLDVFASDVVAEDRNRLADLRTGLAATREAIDGSRRRVAETLAMIASLDRMIEKDTTGWVMLSLAAPRMRIALANAARASSRSSQWREGSPAGRFWLEMETRWLLLADSFAQVERITSFLASINGHAPPDGESSRSKAFLTTAPRAGVAIMDRKIAEQHLLQAEEAVLAGETHIERQRKIISDLEQKGQDATVAKDLLGTFLALQHEHLAHRDRLRLELGLGR